MIAYFPAFYPDELLYSRLSRYYIKSGHIAYIFAARELLKRSTDRPDIEFLNLFSPDAVLAITDGCTMEQVVMNHTMFPYYGRFLQRERRQRAFNALIRMEPDYKNHLSIQQNKGHRRFLRYCPLCVQADRRLYGETYWHRIHQLSGMDICPVHKCFLCASGMAISSEASPAFYDADSNIGCDVETRYCHDELECAIAEYAAKVFMSSVDMDSDITAGEYLHYRIAGTKYLSARGKRRNISELFADFAEYYKSVKNNRVNEVWQLQKIMTGDRVNFYEICLLSLFMQITPDELAHPELPDVSITDEYDRQIFQMHEQGLNYRQIANIIGGSYDTVKSIGEKRYGKYHCQKSEGSKARIQRNQWNDIDKATLPLVEDAINQLCGDGTNRPCRVTVASVERFLKLPSKRFELLPRCKAMIIENAESQDEFWAKELVWAANKLIAEGCPINKTRLKRLTNIRPDKFERCIPFLRRYGTVETVEMLESVLSK